MPSLYELNGTLPAMLNHVKNERLCLLAIPEKQTAQLPRIPPATLNLAS